MAILKQDIQLALSMGKLLPNGVCMRYDSMELGVQAEFRITRGRDGEFGESCR